MKTVSLWLCLLILCSSLADAQRPRGHRDPTPQDRDAIPSASAPAARGVIDHAQLRRDADELATLAQSVPSDIEKAAKGLLPKDLNEKLKRIEKLSKRLREQLTAH